MADEPRAAGIGTTFRYAPLGDADVLTVTAALRKSVEALLHR
ncbi:hypothetical protein [Streptomyces sp. NPDC087300]